MSDSSKTSPTPKPDLRIAMPDVVKFVRQLSHDLRNHLNAAELQAAYVAEIASDGELQEEIKRLRAMISEVGASLQRVTSALSPARLTSMPYEAADLMDDLRQKLASLHPDENAKMEWSMQGGDAMLQIDPQILLPALLELFENAFRHERAEGVISVDAQVENRQFVLTIREPKPTFEHSTENWGREPLRTVGHGHYGLGLHRSRAIIEAHDGKFDAHYDSNARFFTTKVVLPLALGT